MGHARADPTIPLAPRIRHWRTSVAVSSVTTDLACSPHLVIFNNEDNFDLILRLHLRPSYWHLIWFWSLARLNERRNEHDLCGISVPKAAAAGPWQRDGVRGDGGGRPYRAAARQSHLVVSLAQRLAAPAATRPLHRSRPDRHGRFR